MRRALRAPRPSLAAALLLTALLGALPSTPAAHEIPARVAVLAFVKPDGDRLRIVARVPLEAMRDVDVPLKGMEYLDVARADSVLRDAARIWIADYVVVYEDGVPLSGSRIVAVRASLPSDRAFERYDLALAQLSGPPLPAATEIPWKHAMLDVLLEYPIRSERARFSITPALAHLGVRTVSVLRFLPPGGGERLFQYEGDPGVVQLDPRWHQAARRFVGEGFRHILDGIDHLLFVLVLVIPFRRFRPLVALVTAFTLAHSITLAAAALGFAPSALWFPPLVETLIAASIVWIALENIVAGARVERRWVVAFAFGLVHGFGFSFALGETMQFAGGHLATALVAFNVGVELGQLLVVALAIPLLALLFRHVVAERMGTIILSALVTHSAWHWMTERGAALREYRFSWPALDLALAAAAMRILLVLVVAGGALWLLSALFGRWLARGGRGEGAAPAER